MQDITGFGVVVNIIASNTFPTGFLVTQFADDSDPLDLPAIQIADAQMGLNGDMVKWAKAAIIPFTLNVIPNGEDDLNLQILGDANRVAQGKLSAFDNITATVAYPDGRIVTLTGGVLMNYTPGNAIAQTGRLKTKSYVFSFENKTGV